MGHASTAPGEGHGPLHCSITFSALLELQPVPGEGDPSLGLLPLTRHQHTPAFCHVLPWPCAPFRRVAPPWAFLNIVATIVAPARHGCQGWTGRVNAFRQLHLNIKSNLPSPFCSSPLAERDELCQCAPGEGKGADEAQRVTWEQAGMVQGTDLRTTCTFSQDPGQERGQLHLASRATHVSAFDQAKQAGLHVANVTCSNLCSGPICGAPS